MKNFATQQCEYWSIILYVHPANERWHYNKPCLSLPGCIHKMIPENLKCDYVLVDNIAADGMVPMHQGIKIQNMDLTSTVLTQLNLKTNI